MVLLCAKESKMTEFEADEMVGLKKYSFIPTEFEINGTKVIDYTAVEHDKIFLVNKKGILSEDRPSWIPELNIQDLTYNDFFPECIKDVNEGVYYVQDRSDGEIKLYKMSLDILAATIDYYIKKERALIKLNGLKKRITLLRAKRSMSRSRYYAILRLLPLCECYKNRIDFSKKKNPELEQIVFEVQYRQIQEDVKFKLLDLNLSKQDYIDAYSKGEETSYGDSKCFDNLYEKYGVEIKKQNGSTFSPEQLERMDVALKRVWGYYGNLNILASNCGLKVSYADNCYQHARIASGIYTPYFNAIGVSVFDENSKRPDLKDFEHVILAHEVAHWLDAEKGKEYHHFYASDMENTLERKIAEKYKSIVKCLHKRAPIYDSYSNLTPRYFRTCECLARAMEQGYAISVGLDLGNLVGYIPYEWYVEAIFPLVNELMQENKKYLDLVVAETKQEAIA